MPRFCLIASFMMLMFASSVFANTSINGVRLWRAPDHTRVVLDLNAPVQHSLSLLNQPASIVIELPNAQFNASLIDLPLENTPISSIRVQSSPKSVKLFLNLKASVKPTSFLLKPIEGMHDRLVIDLYDESPDPSAQLDNLISAVSNRNTPADANPQMSSLPSSGAQSDKKNGLIVGNGKKRKIVIVVDAGHGGEDPGAIGPKKVREKDVTLAIAKELVNLINAQNGYIGKLTRTSDYFIPLKKRRDIARNLKADLFISIHADAFRKTSARGASVFALSRTGATSETARFLAERENESDLIGGVGSISLDDKDEVLAGVLVDLSMTATLGSSLQVGNQVLTSLGAMTHLHKHNVEQAGFVVLKAPDVPSILVETGFISNPDEAKKLSNANYRKQIANSIFKGIDKYFTQHPPIDLREAVSSVVVAVPQNSASSSVVAITKTEIRHVVVKGDTLTSIALRYNIKVKQLMDYNNLKSPAIKIGQTLKIPAN